MLKFWYLKMVYSHELCVGITLFGGEGGLKALSEKNVVVCCILIPRPPWRIDPLPVNKKRDLLGLIRCVRVGVSSRFSCAIITLGRIVCATPLA